MITSEADRRLVRVAIADLERAEQLVTRAHWQLQDAGASGLAAAADRAQGKLQRLRGRAEAQLRHSPADYARAWRQAGGLP